MNLMGIDLNYLPEPLSKEETRELFQRMINGDKLAREKIASHNVRLVISLINRKFSNPRYDKQELISLGLEILMKAIDTYDVTKNVEFSTYAWTCIKNRILNYLRSLQKDRCVESLNKVCYHDNESNGDINVLDLLSDGVDIQEDCIYSMDMEAVASIVNNLPVNERNLIDWYYYKQYTQKQIAEKLGITTQYAGILIKKALKKLGASLIESGVIELDSYSR